MIESVAGAATRTIIYFLGSDEDGDLLDYAVTRLPEHGLLELESGFGTSDESIAITNVTFRCWETTFSRYRLVWSPEENSNEAATIGIKAWDGLDYSAEATISLTVIPIDGLPAPVPANYSANEDAGVNILLHVNDVDSEFVSLFITALPAHGKLYQVDTTTGERGEEITKTYSPWDVVPPIEQLASSVRAVSTFWPSGDDSGNGYPSWHPFQILGPQNSPNIYADSVFAWCGSSLQGTTEGIQSGGDGLISFSHDTWASYLSEGYTEYIEVR